MKKEVVIFGILALLALLVLVSADTPSVSFISPTPTENVSGNSIYVNLSTSSSLEHYSFVDFDRDVVLWMKMSDINGNTSYDNSSYGNNGTLMNGANVVSGKYGNAFNGDGIDNYIRINDSSSFDAISTANRLSVCVWIKPYSLNNSFGSSQGVLGQYWTNGSSNLNKSFSIAGGIPGAGKYAFYVSNDGSGWQDAQTNAALNLNQWTHLCGIYNGTLTRMYVNGTLQTDTGSLTSIYNPPSTIPFAIGTYFYSANLSLNSSIYFNGSIDEVLILKRALSQTEINAIYNSSVNRFSNNYTSLTNGSHNFTAYAVSTDANFSSVSRTIYTGANVSNGTVNDTTAPSISFVSPTETSGQTLNRSYILVNVSASDSINLTNITIRLYNSSGLINSTTSLTSPNYINFSGLSNTTYYFNATAYDNSSNNNYTETRNITINMTQSGGNSSNSSINSSINISFISPTPTENVSGNSIYVNLSTSSTLEHYSFVDFDRDVVLWMRMDDTNGVIYDNSSYKNNGTLLNGANMTSGKYGNAFNGDGNNNYLTIADSASLDSLSSNNQMSVCTWVKPYSNSNDYGTTMAVLGQWNVSNQKSFSIAEGISGVGIYTFYVSNDGTNWQDAQSNSALTLNQWAHLCGTMDGTTSKLYVNGVLQTDTGTISSIYNSNMNLSIGYYPTATPLYYNGSIDEVLLFNRALSIEEVRAIYNSSTYASFNHNYTSLTNGSHTFTGYAIDVNASWNSTSRIIASGNSSSNSSNSSNSSVPVITLNSATSQENNFLVWISTNIASSMCWLTFNSGATNHTMYENSSTTFYYEDFDAGSYNMTFYCQNTNGTGNKSSSFSFRKSYIISDHSYVNSQGLRIYFDFGYNYTANSGGLVIIPDSWTAVKDTTWVVDAENYFIARGYAAAPVDTRGKGSSEGSKDALGWECLDIYELAEYLKNTYPYNLYIDPSKIYIAGASGAGGKAGICPSKYPDYFSATYSSVGVLNMTKWWYTAGGADVSEITTRVGCTPAQCPEAYLNRDAAYLNYNTGSSIMAVSNADDDRVTVNCSRDFNRTMVENGKDGNYTEYPTGGHSADFTNAHWWFSQHTLIPTLSNSGELRIPGKIHTKNFSISLNTMNYTGSVNYYIYNNSYQTYNVTTWLYNNNSTFNFYSLIPNTNYTINSNSSEIYIVSDSNGDLSVNISLSNYNSNFVTVSKVVSSVSEYCGDSMCNNGETCSTCSGDCGVCSSSGSGGGGGSSKKITPIVNATSELSIEKIQDLIATPGENKKITLDIKNTGTSFLNDCRLSSIGQYSSWIQSSSVRGLAAGEEANLLIDLNIPAGIDSGKYLLELKLNCKETNKTTSFTAEIINKKVDFTLIEVKRSSEKGIEIIYSLKELAGINQEISVQFLLMQENKKIIDLNENKTINANSEETFTTQLTMDSSIEGGLELLINLNSETYSSFVKEDIILSPFSGFTVFGETKGADDVISWILITGFGIFTLIVIIRILKHRIRNHIKKEQQHKFNKK